MQRVILLACALALPACTNTLRHEIVVELDLKDDCLLHFPSCSGDTYTCVDADNTPHHECRVACVAARTMTCEEDGPECLQSVGDDVPVPVVCVSKD